MLNLAIHVCIWKKTVKLKIIISVLHIYHKKIYETKNEDWRLTSINELIS